jgi:tetratricopeptide (TPR) repeat protein
MVREASALDRAGRVPDAIAAYERVLARWPELSQCWYSLAVLHRRTGDFAKALASYRQALDRGVKRPEEVHLNRGVIYSDYLRQPEAAERELHAALALNPVYVPALINFANLQEDFGRRETALTTYERILTLDPGCFVALARYANLKNVAAADDEIVGRLRRALAAPTTSVADAAALGFALGRALDQCGAYAEAFEAYATANRRSAEIARQNGFRYDRDTEARFVDRLIAAFPRPGCVAGSRSGRPVPVFVCGMFRSGSTLIEQLLARHAGVTAGGELEFVPHMAQHVLAPFPESMDSISPERLEELAAAYLAKLGELFRGTDVVTDKRPDNFLFIGLIKTLFPHAKIVHTTRDALDNCLSLFFLHLDHRMGYALDLMDAGHYYRQYLRLMAHWKRVYGADIIDIPYDEFVVEPGAVARRLFEFLELEWDDRYLELPPAPRAIRTASVWQVREPIYRTSSGRAGHYSRQLAALAEYLQQPDVPAGSGYLPPQAPLPQE